MSKNIQEQYVIEVNNVSKDFKIYYDKGYTLKERLLFWKRNRHEVRHVLKNISFKVKKGEVLGLIGQNGAGKSTTLKLLSKIIYPTSGNIIMRGRVACLIELGAGFHPDMSGRENIYINASIFGLTKKEIDERIDDIIAFSELKDFIDNPVRTYSSGMYMRLAFSVAINVDADILLIDEILAVGDAAFQAKCFNKLRDLKVKGITIVIVSHSLGQIELICDRTIWFKNGIICKDGRPYDVHPYYLEYMGKKESNDNIDDKKLNCEDSKKMQLRSGSNEVKIAKVVISDIENKKISVSKVGMPFIININYETDITIKGVVFGIAIYRNDGLHCYGVNTNIDRIENIILQRQGVVKFIVIANELLAGNYWIDVAIHKEDGFVYDYWKKCAYLKVYSDLEDIGVMRLEHKWIFEK